MKKTFNFGKIDYTGKGRKAYGVELDVELRDSGGKETFFYDEDGTKVVTGVTPKYTELSICGYVWNTKHTDWVCGGQCLDTINEYRDQLKNVELWDELYDYWKKYHLNGMNAGTPEQEEAIKEWRESGHDRYDYNEICNMLKEKGLYEVEFTGMTVGRMYDHELYKYGHAWIVEALPTEVENRIRELVA